jgi:hypothetical protein
MGPRDEFRGMVCATGSAGTLAAGDYLKEVYPTSKIGASEALQCPTLLYNGFGEHRLEGIGDKHIPWIHNVKNTDLVMGIDDEAAVSLMRLFNCEVGQRYLAEQGVGSAIIERLPWLGLSCIGNLLSAIKFAHYYELGENDVVMTVFTDSMAMYGSRLQEYDVARGPLDERGCAGLYHRYLLGQGSEHVEELSYRQKKRVHNLKYYTWVEQQGKTYEQLQEQWQRTDYWTSVRKLARQIDPLIIEFNERTGLLDEL